MGISKDEIVKRLQMDIVCSDFNMVEKPTNKWTKCGWILSGIERMTWEVLKVALNIKELVHSNGNLKFSWDNQRKRLDVV